jgi:hypothetical protein
MTVKQKFEKIDQSKLAQAQVDILKSMQAKTDNFKTKDKEALEKIEMGLDKIIAKLQESNPDALKSTARKTTGRAKAKTKSASTTGGKNNVMALAKKIRKPNESWADAQKRAKESLQGDIKQANKVVTSELQKLKAFINRRKQLKGIAGTDLLKDSKRQAKPRGQRISKDGNVYYEYRENRTDRLAPNYPKNSPLLATGGVLPNEYVRVVRTGSGFYIVEKKTTQNDFAHTFNDVFYELSEAENFAERISKNNKIKYIGVSTIPYDFVKGNKMAIGGGVDKWTHNLKYLPSKKVYFDITNGKVYPKLNLEPDMSKGKMVDEFDDKWFSELSDRDLGTIKNFTNSKKFAGGGYNEGIEEDIDMTDDYVLRVNKGVQPKDRASMREWMGKTNESREAMAYELGGATMQYDLAGNTGGGTAGLNADMPLSGVSGTKYTDLVGETGALSSGEMFARGGSTDHKYLNHSQDYEVRYAKGKNRHGYGNLRFAGGGSVGDDFEEIIDLGAEQYYTRPFGIVESESNGEVELVAVATIKDLEDYISEEELPEEGNFQLDITLVPTEQFISDKILEIANDEDTSISDDSVLNVVNYAGGLNYSPHERVFFKTHQGALNYLMSDELKEQINRDSFSSDYIMYKKYNRLGQTNSEYLDYLMGVKDRFARGGSTDHKYLNHSQDYEVRYAKGRNRHGYGNLKFATGGAVMANQQVIADASQQYVNYYLGEGATAGMYKKGGSIPNNYDGRTPRDIWNSLTKTQRHHFLHDHKDEILEEKKFSGFSDSDLIEAFNSQWFELDDVAKNVFAEHTSRGQYAKGAIVPSKYNVSIQYPTKSSRSNWASNDNVDIKVVAKNKVEAEKKALDEFSKKFPMQKPNYVRVTKDEVSSFDNLSLKKGGMMPKPSTSKHRND